ncbi:fibronectin type III domain-containing protein, partial [Patescibacteria group bacterium]|nr:fibronectin type III domain-containing protein [Patescibacteria group bacterium]
SGTACNYIIGVWTNTTVTVGTPDITPPIISSVSVSSITINSATINWTTNEPADSQVEYGLSVNYGQQTNLNSTLTTNHSIIINGLSAGTLYHFRVLSKDGNGNVAASTDYNFYTAQGASVPCPTGASQRR